VRTRVRILAVVASAAALVAVAAPGSTGNASAATARHHPLACHHATSRHGRRARRAVSCARRRHAARKAPRHQRLTSRRPRRPASPRSRPAPKRTPTPVAAPTVPVADPASSGDPRVPRLWTQGAMLHWTAVRGAVSYVVATIVGADRRTTYRVVSGTSLTLEPRPGQTVAYGVRANVDGAPWAKETTISYPADGSASTAAPTPTPTAVPPPSSGTGGWPAFMKGVDGGLYYAQNRPGDSVVSDIKSLGARYSREDVASIADLQGEVASAQPNGIKVLPVISTPGNTDPNYVAGLCRDIAAGYGPGTSANLPVIEVWNEPYDDYMGLNHDPALYARIFVACARAAHAANSNIKVLISSNNGVPIGWKDWNAGMFKEDKAGLISQIDGISVHPYSGDPTETGCNWCFDEQFSVRQDMINHGVPVDHAKLVITEMGWPTWGTGWSGGSKGHTEAEAGQFYRSALSIVNAHSDVIAGVFPFALRDNPSSTNIGNAEGHFGLLRMNCWGCSRDPKPSWYAVHDYYASH